MRLAQTIRHVSGDRDEIARRAVADLRHRFDLTVVG
jgi:hypothetical protein